MAGRRTSVYLSDELDAAIKASGVPMAELLQRGLAAGVKRASRVPRGPVAEMCAELRPGPVAAMFLPPGRQASADCAHPKARITKGLCNACGTHVG